MCDKNCIHVSTIKEIIALEIIGSYHLKVILDNTIACSRLKSKEYLDTLQYKLDQAYVSHKKLANFCREAITLFDDHIIGCDCPVLSIKTEPSKFYCSTEALNMFLPKKEDLVFAKMTRSGRHY